MEILQTLWTALTTENEILIHYITLPMLIIELTISMLLFTTILNISSSKKQRVLYILLLSFIGICTNYLIPTPYNTFINLIACPICVYLIFKSSILKSILSELLTYIAFAIVGLIIMNVWPTVLNLPTNIFLNIPLYKILSSLLIYFFVFMFYLFFKKFNINIINLSENKHNNRILLINFIFGIISIFAQSYLVSFYNEYIPVIINLLSLFIIFSFFAFSMYSLYRTYKLEKTTQDLEAEKLYNKTLTILYDNIRGFRHDFNNIVQAIGGYISSNDINSLREYYNGLLEDCQKSNNLSVLNPELINNPAIYSLLTSKYHKAEELGIKTEIDALLDLSAIKIKPYEFSKILGILLDNAIEAAQNSKEKIINVFFKKDTKGNRDLIIIENSYSNKEVNTDKIFEKGYTSKEDDIKNHGLGLWEVRQILRKNNNLNLHTSKTQEIFKQQLEIY